MIDPWFHRVYNELWYKWGLGGRAYCKRIDFFHGHKGETVIGILRYYKGYTKCMSCNTKFPSYQKLRTMVKLKELTE